MNSLPEGRAGSFSLGKKRERERENDCFRNRLDSLVFKNSQYVQKNMQVCLKRAAISCCSLLCLQTETFTSMSRWQGFPSLTPVSAGLDVCHKDRQQRFWFMVTFRFCLLKSSRHKLDASDVILLCVFHFIVEQRVLNLKLPVALTKKGETKLNYSNFSIFYKWGLVPELCCNPIKRSLCLPLVSSQTEPLWLFCRWSLLSFLLLTS